MAAATLSSSAIDLKTQASYPVRLGSSILKPAESKRWTSVRYNHKPRLKDSNNALSSIKYARATGEEELTIKDGKDEYRYSGKAAGDGDRYVLVCKGNANDKQLVLEKLEASSEFTLTKTPSETDATKLAAQFPHLMVDEDADNDLFGDGEDIEEPLDPSNPWDYRNYLRRDPAKARDRNTVTKESKPSTPSVQPRAASTTPLSRPTKRSDGPLISQKKRKAQDNSKANPKRVKAGTEPPAPVSSKPKARTDIPKLQVERKATIRRSSLDDSGELILENETPISEKLPQRQSAMALALSGQLGQGPISLHSAANSPAGSRVASPTPSRPEGMEEGEEFEFGESSSPEAPAKTRGRHSETHDDVELEKEDEDADADIEDFELPSPVQAHHRTSVSAATGAGGDDDDDLDKQLALAMAEEDEGSVQAAPLVNGSEEESEEE